MTQLHILFFFYLYTFLLLNEKCFQVRGNKKKKKRQMSNFFYLNHCTLLPCTEVSQHLSNNSKPNWTSWVPSPLSKALLPRRGLQVLLSFVCC